MATSVVRLSQAEPRIRSGSVSRSTVTTLPDDKDFAVGKWSEMKPRSGYLEHSGLKWERVKNIVHNSLVSPSPQERIDAARHLGALRCGDPMVIYALRESIQNDMEPRVVFEATKAMVTLGCWDEEVLANVVSFFKDSNHSIRDDLLKTIMNSKNVQYIDKRHKSFSELATIISHLCKNPDPLEPTSFHAAVCIGKLCMVDDNAITKLREVMATTSKTHDKAQALDILVRQMNEHDPLTVQAVIAQLRNSPVWKYRKEAAHHLITIGPRNVRQNKQKDELYDLLERLLWDEPNKQVRLEVAKALAALDLFARACEKVEKRLTDPKEEIRAQAVISIGTLGMKAERILRSLLEMMELDGSDYVRLMIIRAFGELNTQDKRIMRVLRDKEKGEGPLARESKKVLQVLIPKESTGIKQGKNSKVKKA